MVTLFFTGGVSVGTWAAVGSLRREVELYERLAPHLRGMNFVTYGGRRDLVYAGELNGIRLLPTTWSRWRRWTLSRLLRAHREALTETEVLKTNQIPGAEIAVEVKRRLGKKLITRCGYLYSRNVEYEHGRGARVRAAYELERMAFRWADVAVVTSERDRQWAVDRHRVSADRVRVVPNHVNTEVFRPAPEVAKTYDLLYVGRSSREKNLPALLGAVRLLKEKGEEVRLVMIGGCAQDEELRGLARGVQVEFVRNVANHELPWYLGRSRAFVLPSFYEGHSKVLIEAMSCALPCIGTNVGGIKDEISHGTTGFLCEPDSESIADAIRTVLSDETLQRQVGENARRYVLDRYSIERVLDLELSVLRDVVRG